VETRTLKRMATGIASLTGQIDHVLSLDDALTTGESGMLRSAFHCLDSAGKLVRQIIKDRKADARGHGH
jgi:hypothetical protein